MILRKIIAIKNVGRFLNYAVSGDVTLKRYNLVFAENGRGKTTLCAILRSLQSGEPAYINGRTTLGNQDVPEITILTDAGPTQFLGGGWSATVPNIAIFDSTFVSENVYSGDAVDLSNRRNLYRVIVGKDGVDLARQVDQLDADIRAKTSEIREKRADVQSHVPPGMTAEEFIILPNDPDIDPKITDKEKELRAAREADQIQSHASLFALTVPRAPDDLVPLLATTIEGLAADAGRRVSEQLIKHQMHSRGEGWLSEGLNYIKENSCPFCGQELANLELVNAYTSYFGASYKALRQEISNARATIGNIFGDRAISQIERNIDANEASVEFWTRYCDVGRPAISSGPVAESLRSLRDSALDLLERKAAKPLEIVAPDEAFSSALGKWLQTQREVDSYNDAVRSANAVIAQKKVATGNANLTTVQAALSKLLAVKVRYGPEAARACDLHQTATGEKKNLEDQKAAVRTNLDQHTTRVIGRYESTINRLLDDFQAGFRIIETRHSYPGGVPSSSFQIQINGTGVDLGDPDTPIDRPSFRNTLSSGDKSTLALAFFLAEVEHDRERTNEIVIFDDPFNSQDDFRKDHTVEKIRKCGRECAQVIVLSHDKLFLKRIWDRLVQETAERKCLQMHRIGVRNTSISEWDIERATQQRFEQDLNALATFYNTGAGNPRDVVSKMRPVLETHCRNVFPSQFTEADMLPSMISKTRQSGRTHPLAPAVDDIEAINLYTRRYHHGEGPQPAMEAINDSELQGFVKKTLDIVGFC